MPDMDDLLQEKLEAVENGTPVDEVLQSLPDGAEELAHLIRLATAVRTVPHPEPTMEQSQVGRQKVLAAAHARTQPLPRSRQPYPVRQPAPATNMRWLLIPGIAGAFAIFLGFAVLLTAFGLWLAGPPGASAATLMDVSGHVEVATAADASQWNVVASGDRVKQGQRIRTSGASSATLVFYEGSRTTVGANAEFILETVDGSWGKGLNVEIAQVTGKTDHSVVPLRGKRSSYIVQAPGGEAKVHGTTFSVAVGDNGSSMFAVRKGEVEVINEKSRVFITSGQATIAEPGETAEAPAYQFALQGTLNADDGDTWTANGVPFTVVQETVLTGDPQTGDSVSVEGRIVEGGARVADSVTVIDASDVSASFTGVVESIIPDTSWVVGGNTVIINPGVTVIGEGIEEGEPVRVTFVVEGDSWIAVSIESLEEVPGEETPDPTATPVPGAKPALEFEPEEIESGDCGSDFSFNGSVVNNGEDADDAAANVELGYVIDMGQDFVEGVTISPASFAAIASGESASFNVHITLNDAWEQATRKQVVKIRVFVAHETNRPEHLGTPDKLKAKMTITVNGEEGECQATETATPDEEEETATPTGTLDPTATPTPGETEEAEVDFCTGAQPHPKATKLAEKYGVAYEVIMNYFCQYHFGFGEIDLAYSLSLQTYSIDPATGTPVQAIFDMRLSGMSWGQIKQELTVKQHGRDPETKPTHKPKPTRKP